MQDYFVFIDTETSGLPKNWKAPYSDEKNWPHIIQMAWIVYDHDFNEICRQNHFINEPEIKIDKSSQKIHHITEEFLKHNGISKKTVMHAFFQDIIEYKPIIIGHFIAFDYHMVNLEFHRLGLENILINRPMFCTMKASKPYVLNPGVELLKLNEFYFELFNKMPDDFHNALSDALNTAKIFFHLLKTRKITTQIMKDQQIILNAELKLASVEKPVIKNLITRLFSL